MGNVCNCGLVHSTKKKRNSWVDRTKKTNLLRILCIVFLYVTIAAVEKCDQHVFGNFTSSHSRECKFFPLIRHFCRGSFLPACKWRDKLTLCFNIKNLEFQAQAYFHCVFSFGQQTSTQQQVSRRRSTAEGYYGSQMGDNGSTTQVSFHVSAHDHAVPRVIVALKIV